MMTIAIAAAATCVAALGMRARTWSDRTHADLVLGFRGTGVPTAVAVDQNALSARGTGRYFVPATDVASTHLMAPPG